VSQTGQFTITQLGYLVFEVSDMDSWSSFASSILGLGCEQTENRIACRLDSRQARLFIEEGSADDLIAMGWELANEDEIALLAADLDKHDIAYSHGTALEAERRCVQGFLRFQDPAGLILEAFWGAQNHQEPFKSTVVKSGFQAEDFGLGHLVITSQNRQQSLNFYKDLLGFKISDYIQCELFGHNVDLVFMHVNGRHHSLAIGGQLEKNIHHFMLETTELTDVGLAFDRAVGAGVPIMQTIGMHPNDRMVSFYANTPSGFQFEFGCNGVVIHDPDWDIQTYDHISVWGHQHPAMLRPRKHKAQK
jgi:2,3-dihydroxybiphenyl 1,2-dioxygenase